MTLFADIKESAEGRELSLKWYQARVRALGKLKGDMVIREGKADAMAQSRPQRGMLNLFNYRPKDPTRISFYDTFPLVFPIEKYPDGFLGLNFHYLAPKHRAILMDQLKMFANNKKYDETTKLKLTYDMLKGFTKIKRARPTVHRYLTSKVKSKFVLVNADEWEVALFLPVERFKKANKKKVWAHSRGMF